MVAQTDIGGLSCEQAKNQLKKYGSNLLPANQPKTLLSIIFGVVSEPMFLMLLIAGGIYLALGDPAEAIFLLTFVFIVITITLTQERKTQRALESLRELSAPRALVVRDGIEVRIAGQEVVPGDLLVLHEGDRIPADALLVQGQLSVDESLLSGEAVPVTKLPNTESLSLLFASTVVTKGVGMAVVQATGTSTAVGHIGQALAVTKEIPSGLQQASRALIKNLTIIGLGVAVALVLLNWLWNERSFLESLLSGIALTMAILPEEVPVILTVFLALGAWRITKFKVLTRNVAAVEALGAITILAVDKTGTLTQNHMQVEELSVGDSLFQSTPDAELPEKFHTMVEFAMLATPSDPFDPMEKAIQLFGHTKLSGTEHVHDDRCPEFHYELSAEILAMTHVYSSERPLIHLLATKGAPEAVADLCHLSEDELQVIQLQVDEMAKRGLRVLGIAKGEWQTSVSNHTWPESQHEFDFVFLGLVGFIDPIRPEVPHAIAECRSAGIRLLMLTGDHSSTAQAIAQQVGLSERAEVIMGDEIEMLNDDALLERLKHADVCARMKPEHKLRLVQILQKGGEVVAMTGDGVNDAPALKAADIGIAMGERGTDVAREAADLVLLDDSFKSIVTAISQGRQIYDNISKATRFVIAVHLPIIALTLIPALLHWSVMLQPIHIVLLQLLIDPACAIVFEAEIAAGNIMNRPPRLPLATPFSRSNIGFAIAQGVGIALILIFGTALLQNMEWSETEIRTILFAALVPTLFLIVLFNRDSDSAIELNLYKQNPWLGYMFIGVSVILTAVLIIPMLRNMMGFASMGVSMLFSSVALLIVCGLWLKAVGMTKNRINISTRYSQTPHKL
ncbi:MAG: cation-translocating P-type ATPase [Sulfurimonas sp.]